MFSKGQLEDVRIVDFTGELGPYASKLYAGVGADVIHLEPIGGDPMRSVGPFYKNKKSQESSLMYQYYNAGKRGMPLNLDSKKGQDIFRELCGSRDILFESFAPGYLEQRNISYDNLRERNNKLVHVSMTPFGSFGEMAHMEGSDLVCSAVGGFLYLAGVDNEKPVRAPDEQSYRMAEAYAAVGGAIAFYHALKSGEGQHVDVSCIESAAMALENAAQYWDLEGKIRRGRGKEAATATIHPCKDGYIVLAAIMGNNQSMWRTFLDWMKAESIDGWQEFDNEKWIDSNYRKTRQAYDLFCDIFERYTRQHTKRYLYETGQSYKVAISPVNNGKDLLENPQLMYREYWKKIHVKELGGEITVPGSPYELSDLEWNAGQAAPYYGQHSKEILMELGYSCEDIEELNERGVVYVG